MAGVPVHGQLPTFNARASNHQRQSLGHYGTPLNCGLATMEHVSCSGPHMNPSRRCATSLVGRQDHSCWNRLRQVPVGIGFIGAVLGACQWLGRLRRISILVWMNSAPLSQILPDMGSE